MNENKVNVFVRVLIVGLIGFIIWLVTYSFIFVEPKGTISSGIATLIVLLIVIALSESFDNFSVGKIFTMSREIKDKEKSLNKLDSENADLRRQLVNVVTSISQNQSSTNIIGLPDFAKQIGVEIATHDEVNKKRDEESEESTELVRPIRKLINHQRLEDIAFSKFLEKRNLTDTVLVKEAKLVTQFSGIDAISNIQPIYDGYINTGESEIFVEVKLSRLSSFMMRERVYLMLNKIFLYNKIRGANAHLNLLLVDIDIEENEKHKSRKNVERIKDFFEPSIINGLLRIELIELTEKEIPQLYSDK